MPTKKKPSPAQLAARKKFVEMVRAKAKAKKSASKHTDTKSHNVNIKVVSGTKKKSETRQTGTSVKSKDKLRSALPPGKRTTGKGKAKHTYIERRANRSDKPGSLTGIKVVGAINRDVLGEITRLTKWNDELEKIIYAQKDRLKTDKSTTFTTLQKRYVKASIMRYQDLLKSNKKHLTQLKKQIK